MCWIELEWALRHFFIIETIEKERLFAFQCREQTLFVLDHISIPNKLNVSFPVIQHDNLL